MMKLSISRWWLSNQCWSATRQQFVKNPKNNIMTEKEHISRAFKVCDGLRLLSIWEDPFYFVAQRSQAEPRRLAAGSQNSKTKMKPISSINRRRGGRWLQRANSVMSWNLYARIMSDASINHRTGLDHSPALLFGEQIARPNRQRHAYGTFSRRRRGIITEFFGIVICIWS